MRAIAHGKINWTLAVLGRRADGYHELDTLMQSVLLGDTLDITEGEGLTLSLSGGVRVPEDEGNLALRAAKLLKKEAGESRGAHIRLNKHIPVGAGLGGGSADGAAVLLGLHALWGLSMPMETLYALALSLGADVPFCMMGGLARAKGLGEKLTPLSLPAPIHLVIIKPAIGLSTPAVFAQYDGLESMPKNPDVDAAVDALIRGDALCLSQVMGNALERAAIPLRPQIAICVQAMVHFGALRAQMTGSGSAVIGLFATKEVALYATRQLRQIWRHTFYTQTARQGVSLLP